MSTTRWCGKIVIAIFLFYVPKAAYADDEQCWRQIQDLPSDTKVLRKVDVILDCTEKQGIVLSNLRTNISAAEKAKLDAEEARDEAILNLQALKEETSRLNLIVDKILNPWEKAADSLYELVVRIDGSLVSHQNVPELQNYEYAMMRNGGFRKLTFSTWNGGWRVMTEPHLTGDVFNNFKLGGSVWLFNTPDPIDDEGTETNDGHICGAAQEKLQHLYYYTTSDDINKPSSSYVFQGKSGNGCTREGPVYRKKRWFSD